MEQFDIEKAMQHAVIKIETTGKEYAEAKGISYHLQQMKKVVLAREMKGQMGTAANREMHARASRRYEEHLEGTKQAIIDETRLRAGYERWRAEYEACRSLLSLEKAKANIR